MSPLSPALSAVRSSTPRSGPPSARLVSSPAIGSSPALSSTQRSPSPDYFDDFVYTSDMDEDLRRIDLAAEVALSQGAHQPPSQNPPDSPSPLRQKPTSSLSTLHQNPLETPSPPHQRVWVVFRGRIPGIYDDFMLASTQTQGRGLDGFQKSYPDHKSAEIAWSAHVRHITYGKGPWVVFLGRKPGVFTNVTELELSVKGHAHAVFRSCSSISEGQVKYQHFAKQVAEMFAGPDPFPRTGSLTLRPREATPVIQAIVPPLPTRDTPLPLASQSAGPSGLGSKRNASDSFTPPVRSSKTPRPSDGWFVAHHAVLPGVYYGVDALKDAGPLPGGFRCASDKRSADQLFHNLTINGEIVWAQNRE